jgi:gas vesicle protein
MLEDREEPAVVIERGGGQIAAFLIGLAIGAGAALLLAPQSGAETRASLVRRAKRARRAAEHFAGDVRDRAEDVYDTARDEVRRRVRETRRGAAEAIDAAKEAGRAAAKAARVELQRRLAEVETHTDGADA